MSNYKVSQNLPSKKTSWKIVNCVRHSPAEIKYVSENEVPPRRKHRTTLNEEVMPKAPWCPAPRVIKHEPVKYDFQADFLSSRPASERQPSARSKAVECHPEKIWKPTNPNSTRPYNELKLSSENLIDIVKADQERHQKEKQSKPKLPLYGPWIPADRRYKRGINWGTINPFPPYDPFLQ